MNIFNGFNFPDLSRSSSGSQTGQANQVSNPAPSVATESGTQSGQPASIKTDQANLSASGLAASASASSASNSDVRMHLVNSIQSAIQAGTYNVSASEVAGSIMKSMTGNGG